jgi:hypothetical protein
MERTLGRFAVASQRASGLRSFQILKRHDELRLRAFFLSFDSDQRHAYFGAGMSDPAIREYCEAIDWENTTIIARNGAVCIDAIVVLNSLPPTHTTAELSLACPLSGNHAQVVCELLDLAVDVIVLRFRKLIVRRGLANRIRWLFCGETRPPVSTTGVRGTIAQRFLQRAIPKGDRDGFLNWLVGLIALYESVGIAVLESMLNGVHLLPDRPPKAAELLGETSLDASRPSDEFSTRMPPS